MGDVSIGSIVKTSIVTAFTIAAALIWKEVIIEGIEKFFPSGDIFYYKIIAAAIATVIVVIVIYVILKTEEEAEVVVKKFGDWRLSRKKSSGG
jgi:hypothetical protein